MTTYRDTQYSVLLWGALVVVGWTLFSMWVGVPWYMTLAIDIGIAIGTLLIPHELTTTVTATDVRLQWTLFGRPLHEPLIIPLEKIENVETIAKEEVGPSILKDFTPKYPATDAGPRVMSAYSKERRTHIADSRAKRAVVLQVPGDLEGAPYIIVSRHAEKIARDVEERMNKA